jgi:hypothetical protein
MIPFSSDVDILKHEPVLFGELYFPLQVKAAGTGAALAGTQLTTDGADFLAANVTPGQVIYLKSHDGALDGAYEIVSVDAPTQLTISVLRADSADAPVPPALGTDVAWCISTFAAQAMNVAKELTAYFGIRPGDPAAVYGIEDILDVEVLRRASTMAVISCIYATWAGKAGDDSFWTKSLHYKQEFEKARLRCHLSIDADGDGVADVTRVSGSIRLVRG